MADAEEEPTISQYPRRKRTSIFNDLSDSKIEFSTTMPTERPERTALPGALNKAKPRNIVGSNKGVVVGHWRDSQVPDLENKHAVIGFLDVRDRLRTRIQPINKDGDTISAEYPLPPGPGGSWVTFDRTNLGGDGAAEEILCVRASGGHELRQLRGAFPDARPARQSLGDIEAGEAGLTTNGASSGRTSHSMQSDGARGLFHESQDIERLNRVWARQESLRLRAGSSEDAKIYDGFKYERKPTGLFMGQLVSQGTIITIEDEDYVEYHMLTKSSLF